MKHTDSRQMYISRWILLIFLWTMVPWKSAVADDIFVPDDFAQIQAALLNAQNGDRIVLSPGTYTGPGNRDLGFAGKAITLTSIAPNTPAVVAATIIDCAGADGNEHIAVFFDSNEGSQTILDGITIQNGYDTFGGAIYCDGTGPTIRNCVFFNNTATGSGGAIYAIDSSPILENNVFLNNTAGDSDGGALAAIDSDLDMSLCLFRGNQALNEMDTGGIGFPFGGGAYFDNTTAILDRCQFINNQSLFGGGLALSNLSNVTITNTLIVGNRVTSGGGGIYNQNAVLDLTNATLSDNVSEALGGGGIRCFDMATANVINCIVWNNTSETLDEGGSQIALIDSSTLTITHCDVSQSQPDDVFVPPLGDSSLFVVGVQNIELDPLFEDPGFFQDSVWQDGDYRLQSISPTRNAGLNTAIAGLELDLEGNDRIINGSVDMGAYESDAVDGPDLTGTLLDFDPELPLVPNDRLKLTYEISNAGNEFAEGKIKTALYLSTNASLETGVDVLLAEDEKVSVKLFPSETIKRKFTAKLPSNLPPTDYFLLIQLDVNNDLSESNESLPSNVIATDEALPLVWQFGNVPGRSRNIKLTVLDPFDPDVPVTFRLSGEGFGEAEPDFERVELTDTTETSSLAITTRGRGSFTTIGTIAVTDDGPLKDINAKTTDLIDGGVSVPTGTVGRITLRHVTDSQFSIGGSDQDTLQVKLDQVSGLRIVSQTPIKNLQVVNWLRGTGAVEDLVQVPWIQNLTVKGNSRENIDGDLETDLLLTGPAGDNIVLKNVKIKGAIRNAFWEMEGSSKKISAALMDNALIFMGVDEDILGISDFVGIPGDFKGNNYELGLFQLTGRDGDVFINNSVLAAETISKFKLPDFASGSGLIEFIQTSKDIPELQSIPGLIVRDIE